MRQSTLVQALQMYLQSAKRQANASNLLPPVKQAIAAEAAAVQAELSQILATHKADDDIGFAKRTNK